MTEFQKMLAVGKQGEAIAKELLQSDGWTVTDLSDDKEAQLKDIDFFVQKEGRTHTLEIKNQVCASRTGNIFIETYTPDNKRRQGKGYYYYCEAEFIGFVIGNQLHIVHWELLKEVCRKCRLINCRTGAGYLVPIAALKNINGYTKLGE